jgi:hypothetical protein
MICAGHVARMLKTGNADSMLAGEPGVSLFMRLGHRSEDNFKRISYKA